MRATRYYEKAAAPQPGAKEPKIVHGNRQWQKRGLNTTQLAHFIKMMEIQRSHGAKLS